MEDYRKIYRTAESYAGILEKALWSSTVVNSMVEKVKRDYPNCQDNHGEDVLRATLDRVKEAGRRQVSDLREFARIWLSIDQLIEAPPGKYSVRFKPQHRDFLRSLHLQHAQILARFSARFEGGLRQDLKGLEYHTTDVPNQCHQRNVHAVWLQTWSKTFSSKPVRVEICVHHPLLRTYPRSAYEYTTGDPFLYCCHLGDFMLKLHAYCEKYGLAYSPQASFASRVSEWQQTVLRSTIDQMWQSPLDPYAKSPYRDFLSTPLVGWDSGIYSDLLKGKLPNNMGKYPLDFCGARWFSDSAESVVDLDEATHAARMIQDIHRNRNSQEMPGVSAITEELMRLRAGHDALKKKADELTSRIAHGPAQGRAYGDTNVESGAFAMLGDIINNYIFHTIPTGEAISTRQGLDLMTEAPQRARVPHDANQDAFPVPIEDMTAYSRSIQRASTDPAPGTVRAVIVSNPHPTESQFASALNSSARHSVSARQMAHGTVLHSQSLSEKQGLARKPVLNPPSNSAEDRTTNSEPSMIPSTPDIPPAGSTKDTSISMQSGGLASLHLGTPPPYTKSSKPATESIATTINNLGIPYDWLWDD